MSAGQEAVDEAVQAVEEDRHVAVGFLRAPWPPLDAFLRLSGPELNAGAGPGVTGRTVRTGCLPRFQTVLTAELQESVGRSSLRRLSLVVGADENDVLSLRFAPDGKAAC